VTLQNEQSDDAVPAEGLAPEQVGALVEATMQDDDANDPLLESYRKLREAHRDSVTTASPNQSAVRRGVVAVVLRGEQFLMIRRSQLVRAPGMHCFPGGSIEPSEGEADAIRREMLEELALEAQPERLLWRSVTPWGVELAWWLTAIDAAAKPVANPLEVESFHWLRAEQIRGLTQLLASNVEFLDAWECGRIER